MNNQEQKIENLYIHIKGLQATLTERNKQIAELQDKLANPGIIEGQQIRQSYKAGWRACAEKLMSETATATNALTLLRSQAFESLLKNEKR